MDIFRKLSKFFFKPSSSSDIMTEEEACGIEINADSELNPDNVIVDVEKLSSDYRAKIQQLRRQLQILGAIVGMAPRVASFGTASDEQKLKFTQQGTSSGKTPWKKGTGYGSGGHSAWDPAVFANEQKEHDAAIVKVVNELKDVLAEVLPATRNNKTSFKPRPAHVTATIQTLQQSCLLPFLATYLKSDSMVEMEAHRDRYLASINLCTFLAQSDTAPFFLTTINKRKSATVDAQRKSDADTKTNGESKTVYKDTLLFIARSCAKRAQTYVDVEHHMMKKSKASKESASTNDSDDSVAVAIAALAGHIKSLLQHHKRRCELLAEYQNQVRALREAPQSEAVVHQTPEHEEKSKLSSEEEVKSHDKETDEATSLDVSTSATSTADTSNTAAVGDDFDDDKKEDEIEMTSQVDDASSSAASAPQSWKKQQKKNKKKKQKQNRRSRKHQANNRELLVSPSNKSVATAAEDDSDEEEEKSSGLDFVSVDIPEENVQISADNKGSLSSLVSVLQDIDEEIKCASSDSKDEKKDGIEEQYVSHMKQLAFDYVPEFSAHKYQSSSSNAVARTLVRRLAHEYADLSRSLPITLDASVFVRVSESCLTMAKMLIIPPMNTPYAAGCFMFDVSLPSNYPQSAPQINLQTTGKGSVRFNPNLYNCGKVCLSLLGTWGGDKSESWNPNHSTLLQLAVSIQSLIFVPEPYFNEPGYESQIGTSSGRSSSESYNHNIQRATVAWAMVDMIENPPPEFKSVITYHFRTRKDAILEKVESWAKTYSDIKPHAEKLKSLLDSLQE